MFYCKVISTVILFSTFFHEIPSFNIEKIHIIIFGGGGGSSDNAESPFFFVGSQRRPLTLPIINRETHEFLLNEILDLQLILVCYSIK